MASSSSYSSSSAAASGGGCGCTSVILFFLLVWALLFGVTWSGTHYAVSCNSESGVEITETYRE